MFRSRNVYGLKNCQYYMRHGKECGTRLILEIPIARVKINAAKRKSIMTIVQRCVVDRSSTTDNPIRKRMFSMFHNGTAFSSLVSRKRERRTTLRIQRPRRDTIIITMTTTADEKKFRFRFRTFAAASLRQGFAYRFYDFETRVDRVKHNTAITRGSVPTPNGNSNTRDRSYKHYTRRAYEKYRNRQRQ